MAWDLQETLAYYKGQGAPAQQSALVALLREIQQENGGSIPMHLLKAVAEGYGIKESFLSAIVGKIPSLRLENRHTLELCAGPNCPKRADLAGFVEKTYGAKPKNFILKYSPCMRMCGKGPNIKWDGQIYHGADEALSRKLVDSMGI